jgi:hypothetical protein
LILKKLREKMKKEKPTESGNVFYPGKFLIGICLFFLLVLWNSPAFAEPLRNIALGRPYVMSCPPDYSSSTESGDKIQLTDGEKRGSSWGISSTVGWEKEEVEVTIDLGLEREFEEVKLFSRCNKYDMGMAYIGIFASKDNREFKNIGILRTTKDAEASNYDYYGCSKTYSVPLPGAKTRYVKIVMRGKKGTFVFCDEIEILSSSPKLLQIKKRKQQKDGSYTYTLAVSSSDARGTEVTLQGYAPWGDVLFKKSEKLARTKETSFSFSLPSELCHTLYFDLTDNQGTVLERCLERINYFLPSSRINPVQVINLEKGWSYQLKNPDKKQSGAEWKKFDLKEGFYPFRPFYAQEKPKIVWHRNKFPLSSIKNKIVKLRLNRVRYSPSIYLNGEMVAEGDLEPNLPHVVDLTKVIKSGENELVIKTYDWRALLVKGAGPKALERYKKWEKETWFAMTPAVTDKDVSTGKYSFIYPPGHDYKKFGIMHKVELLVLPEVYIEDIRISPSVANKKLSIEIQVRNCDSKRHKVIVSNLIGDIKNPSIKKLLDKEIELLPLTSKTISIEEKWEDAVLWWPKSPHLYHIATILKEGNEILESKDTRFGFREITADGPVLKLNGKRCNLFGIHRAVSNDSYPSLKRFEEHNFNAWRTWGGASWEELLNAADEMGFFIIDESNHFARFVNASQDFWDNCFSHFKRRVKRDYNHPSVIAYSTQNEYIPGKSSWAPSKWEKERMDELIQRMNKEDPGRLSGHEGSFNRIGEASSSETILFPHYAAEGTDDDEYLLPNYYYFWKESFKGTIWEKRPLYIGEMGLAWDFRSNIPDASAIYNMGDKIYRNWRSAKKHFDYNQIVGVSPNTWTHTPELRKIHKKLLSPFYIQVKEYSRFFYARERIKRSLVLYNDFLDGKGEKRLIFVYELKDGEKVVDRGEKEILIEDGEKNELDIHLNMPGVKERKSVKLSLKLFYEGKVVFESEKLYSVFPQIAEVASNKQVLLYDKKGDTGAFLKKISLNYVTLNFSKLNPLKDILIIGKDNLNEEVMKNKEKLESFVKNGGVVISLSQEKSCQWLPIPLILDSSHPSTINYLRATGHTLLKGIKEDDLKFWGEDNLTTSSNFKKPALGGYRAIVDTAGIKGLLWSPLLEIPYHKGTYILCQFDLVDKFFSEPVAGILLRNMLIYANQKRKDPSNLAILKETDERIKKSLHSAGIEFDELEAPPDRLASGYNLFFLNGKVKLSKEGERRLKDLVEKGGVVILHHLSPSSPLLSLMPEKISLQPVNIDNPKKAVIHTDYTPITYGMSNQIFYWLRKSPPEGNRPWPPSPEIADYQVILSEGSKAEVLLDPSLLIKFPSGEGYFLVDQINWENVSGSNKKKAKDYLRNLFTNLGLTIRVRTERAKTCFPIDISPFCNMGFADEKAGDRKGGWTDQGPKNDLRVVPVGEVKFKGISFSIIDPDKNQGKSCIVLKSEHSPWGIEKIKGVKVGRATPFLYFLQASAYIKSGEEMAKYIINYKGGEKIEIPIIGGKNIGEWWKPVPDLPEAEVAWEGPNPQVGTVGLYLFTWKNPFAEREIETIDIESNNKRSVPCLVAISGERR